MEEWMRRGTKTSRSLSSGVSLCVSEAPRRMHANQLNSHGKRRPRTMVACLGENNVVVYIRHSAHYHIREYLYKHAYVVIYLHNPMLRWIPLPNPLFAVWPSSEHSQNVERTRALCERRMLMLRSARSIEPNTFSSSLSLQNQIPSSCVCLASIFTTFQHRHFWHAQMTSFLLVRMIFFFSFHFSFGSSEHTFSHVIIYLSWAIFFFFYLPWLQSWALWMVLQYSLYWYRQQIRRKQKWCHFQAHKTNNNSKNIIRMRRESRTFFHDIFKCSNHKNEKTMPNRTINGFEQR